MKTRNFLTVTFLLISCFDTVCSVGYLQDTKIQDCSFGLCRDMCLYDNLKLLPDTEEVNDGKCRRVKCNTDFSVVVK